MFTEDEYLIVKQSVHFVVKHANELGEDKEKFGGLSAKFDADYVQLTHVEFGRCCISLCHVINSLLRRRQHELSVDEKAAITGMLHKRQLLSKRMQHMFNNWEKYKVKNQ